MLKKNKKEKQERKKEDLIEIIMEDIQSDFAFHRDFALGCIMRELRRWEKERLMEWAYPDEEEEAVPQPEKIAK